MNFASIANNVGDRAVKGFLAAPGTTTIAYNILLKASVQTGEIAPKMIKMVSIIHNTLSPESQKKIKDAIMDIDEMSPFEGKYDIATRLMTAETASLDSFLESDGKVVAKILSDVLKIDRTQPLKEEVEKHLPEIIEVIKKNSKEITGVLAMVPQQGGKRKRTKRRRTKRKRL